MDDLAIIDRFTETFSRYIDSGFGLLAGDVAFLTSVLVAIDITLAGLFWALMGEDSVPAQLIRKVLYVGFFALILSNFKGLADIVFQSFAGLGLKASGASMTAADLMRPGFVASTGFTASRPLLEKAGELIGITTFFSNLIVPEKETAPTATRAAGIGLLTIYRDPRFRRIAPLAALGVGTAFSLQGLWAAPWLTDVAGLDRPAVVAHLTLMAAVLSASALLLGALAERLRRAGIPTELFLAGTLVLSMAAQLALLLGVPISSQLPFAVVAAAGASHVLSFAALARYFPKEVAGRANAALGVLNMGAAFALQSLGGFIIGQWPQADGRYPVAAHQTAMAIIPALQVIALAWFAAPRRRPRQMPMALAVARVLGFGPSIPAPMPTAYAAALSAWRRHVVDTRRQATAWRFAAAASLALCAGLAASLAQALTRPAVALHVVQGTAPPRISADGAPMQPTTPVAIPSVLEGPHLAGSSSGPPHAPAEMGGIAAKK